ncbi:MAG: type II secretion system protein [Acetivibrio sp.]
MKTGRKTENKGFSMIELIIVITVLSILISGSLGTLQYISYGNTKKCAAAINTALNQVQLENMSKSDTTYLYIYREDKNCYLKIWNQDVSSKKDLTNGKKIANGSVSISYKEEATGNEIPLDPQNPASFLKIAYDKGTGAFLDSLPYSEIILEGRVSYRIQLVKKTGKHYIE